MKEIPLTQGKVAIIDDDMFDRVSYFKWFAYYNNGIFYAGTNIVIPNKKRMTLQMHQLIMGIPGSIIDHKDFDGLNNQKINLRPATKSQNNMNRRKTLGKTSKYKGVHWRNGKWKTQIRIDGKQKAIGLFVKEKDAAMAYDKYCILNFGEFAYLNFK